MEEKRDAEWKIEGITSNILKKYRIFPIKNNKIKISKDSDANWIYSQWERIVNSKKRPKFLLQTMHTYLVGMMMCITFAILFFPLAIFSLTQTNPMTSIFYLAFALFFALFVSVVSGWLVSVKFYVIVLRAYRMENVLREVFPRVNFESNFWFVIGSIVLSKDKRIHRNNLRKDIGCTNKGIEDILNRWSKLNIISYSESKFVSLNNIDIALDHKDLKIKEGDVKDVKRQLRNLIYIRGILECLRKL